MIGGFIFPISESTEDTAYAEVAAGAKDVEVAAGAKYAEVAEDKEKTVRSGLSSRLRNLFKR